jgi:hypothetical protein
VGYENPSSSRGTPVSAAGLGQTRVQKQCNEQRNVMSIISRGVPVSAVFKNRRAYGRGMYSGNAPFGSCTERLRVLVWVTFGGHIRMIMRCFMERSSEPSDVRNRSGRGSWSVLGKLPKHRQPNRSNEADISAISRSWRPPALQASVSAPADAVRHQK